MIVDDSIGFRFYTRTLSEDYRVFAGGGGEVLNYAEEFAPFIEIADVRSEDEESAVIFEDSGSVYVAAFDLLRDGFDRGGRIKRFSFCLILPAEKKAQALQAFSRVVNEWQATAKAVNSLIEERPAVRKDWKGRDLKGEDVRFDYRQFARWLESKPANIAPPKAGVILKYFADTGEIFEIGTEDEDDSGEGYTRRPMAGTLAVLVLAGCLIWYFMRGGEPSKPQVQPLKSQDVQSSQQAEQLPESLDVTSKNLKEVQDNGGHNNVNNIVSASVANAQKAYHGGTSGEGSISQNSGSNDRVGSNDRNSNNENQGGDDPSE